MLAGDEPRTDVLSAERTDRFVREEFTARRRDAPALRALRLHAHYLREVAPKGRTKLATKTTTLVVGDQAPDFTLRAHDGRTITLSALRGQRVVLAFMAFAFSGT